MSEPEPEPREATARPVVLAVDDEPSVARAVERDLRRRYGRDYRVLRAESGEQALEALRQSKLRGAPIALLIADQRMPVMSGVEFLEQAIELAPEAKRVLLTAYADTQAAIDAINRVALDHYLLKPWDPPEEQLYPVVDDLLDHVAGGRARAFRPDPGGGPPVVEGVPRRPRLPGAKSGALPAGWTWSAKTRPAPGSRPADGTPTCRWCCSRDGGSLPAPTVPELAERARAAHARRSCPSTTSSIVGGGPAGLAAAVYGASEGLRTAADRARRARRAGRPELADRELPGLPGRPQRRRSRPPRDRPGDAASGAELLTAQEVAGHRRARAGHDRAAAEGAELGCRGRDRRDGCRLPPARGAGVEELTGRGVYYGGARSEGVSCAWRARRRGGRRQLGRPGGHLLRRLCAAGHGARTAATRSPRACRAT